MILLRRPRFWLALLLAIAAGLFVTALPQQPRVTLPYAGNIDSKSLTAELWLMLIWAGKDFAFTPDSQQIAVVTERPKVEAGLGTVNDIGHDVAHDGPEPEPMPAHPGGDDKAARAAPAVDDR